MIQGNPPAGGGATAVFIDIIGLPFTPLSFAGVARRTAYRSMAYGAAASSAAAHSANAPAPTPAQRLQELESLYKQGLISQREYEAGKAKILAQITE